MIPFKLLDTASNHGASMKLYQRGTEFSIRVDKAGELMNSRLHHSEDALAVLACDKLHGREHAKMLVGGLGMGFTLAAALEHALPCAEIVVSELMPAVVRWNREYLGELTQHPLHDARVSVLEQDVAKVMAKHRQGFDAIMLDVDNGPDAFTRSDNDALYGLKGLNRAYDALTRGGVLTVWSAFKDPQFTQRMMKVGFDVEEHQVPAHLGKHSAMHTIWLGVRLDG